MGALQRWKAAAIGSHSKDARKVLQSAAAAAATSKTTDVPTTAGSNSSGDKRHAATDRELVAQVLSALQATSLHTRARSTTATDSSSSSDDTDRYSKAVTGVAVHVLRADGSHEQYTEQQLIDVLKCSEHSGGDHAAAAT
jgi:hypothetical protein